MFRLSCGVLLLLFLLFLIVAWYRPDLVFPTRPLVFWTVKLQSGDVMECGLQTYPGPLGYRGDHITYVRWRHGSEKKDIYVTVAYDRQAYVPHGWSTFDLRASEEGKRVWYVHKGEKASNAFAAIDLQTGQCWNNQGLVKTHMSIIAQYLARRDEHFCERDGLPKWADPEGGKLIARLDEEHYRENRRESIRNAH